MQHSSLNAPINEEKVHFETKHGSSQNIKEESEEDIDEKVANKEKSLNYEDTPFYLKQDRPVFLGKER